MAMRNAQLQVIDQSVSNRKMMRKIRAFDQRWQTRVKEAKAAAQAARLAAAAESDGPGLNIAMQMRFQAAKKAEVAVAAPQAMVEGLAKEEDLIPLPYTVCNCSSQDAQFPVSNLEEGKGHWQSAQGRIRAQNIVFNLGKEPATINGIEFSIGDVLSCPKRCRVQYSTKGAQGPWTDAWTFTVQSPGGTRTVKSQRLEYGDASRRFCQAVWRYCGDKERAWDFLSPSGAYYVSLDDILQVCRKLQQEHSKANGSSEAAVLASQVLAVDLKQVFRERDLEGTGRLGVEDLLQEQCSPPLAQWWRLVLVDTWGGGSSSYISVGSPCVLSTKQRHRRASGLLMSPTQSAAVAGLLPLGLTQPQPKAIAAVATSEEEEEDKRINARIAMLYEANQAEVSEVHEVFRKAAVSKPRLIDRGEFFDLLSQFFDVDPSKIPVGHQEFLWDEAAAEGCERVSFEDFFQFFIRAKKHVAVSGANPGSTVFGRDPHWEILGSLITGAKRARKASLARLSTLGPGEQADAAGGELGKLLEVPGEDDD